MGPGQDHRGRPGAAARARLRGLRRLLVPPERLARWVGGFGDRHGAVEAERSPDVVRLRAADGAVADLEVPHPPLPADGADRAADPVAALAAHAARPWRLGLVLLRRGGMAVALAEGDRLVASKVDRRRVQGRTAAGGWSQQRFARRRAEQTDAMVELTADHAARLLVPHAAELDGVVLGGDRLLLRSLRDDRRLAPLWARPAAPALDVRDPRHDVLVAALADARSVRIELSDPPRPAGTLGQRAPS